MVDPQPDGGYRLPGVQLEQVLHRRRGDRPEERDTEPPEHLRHWRGVQVYAAVEFYRGRSGVRWDAEPALSAGGHLSGERAGRYYAGGAAVDLPAAFGVWRQRGGERFAEGS